MCLSTDSAVWIHFSYETNVCMHVATFIIRLLLRLSSEQFRTSRRQLKLITEQKTEVSGFNVLHLDSSVTNWCNKTIMTNFRNNRSLLLKLTVSRIERQQLCNAPTVTDVLSPVCAVQYSMVWYSMV